MLSDIRSFANYQLKFGRPFKEKLKETIELKELSNDRLLEIQNEKFLKIFRHAIRRSKFYKKLYTSHGISQNSIRSILDIEKLPVLTKSDIKNHIDDIYTGLPFSKVKGYTSGTSGSPLTVFRTYDSVLKETAFIWAHRHYFGYHPGMKTVSLRGDLGKNEMMRFDKFSNTLYLSSYNINERNAAWYFNKIQSFAPYAILAYPSSVEGLANLFRINGKEIKVPYIFTSSETLYENQRNKIEAVFNTKIYDWYGNAERTIALEQRPDNQYYELPLYSYNEFQKDSAITTSLTNICFPLIRYQVTDIIEHAKYTSNQGSERFRIDKILGRHDDVLILPDETKIGRLDVIFKNIDNIEYAQFIQRQKERFVLNLVTTHRYNDQDQNKIIENLKYRIGKNVSFDINRVRREDIIFSKSGKFKLVINEI